MWEHKDQGPREREAEEKLGNPCAKVIGLHGTSAAFSFPSFFSLPSLAELMPLLISLQIKSKATRFGQRKDEQTFRSCFLVLGRGRVGSQR